VCSRLYGKQFLIGSPGTIVPVDSVYLDGPRPIMHLFKNAPFQKCTFSKRSRFAKKQSSFTVAGPFEEEEKQIHPVRIHPPAPRFSLPAENAYSASDVVKVEGGIRQPSDYYARFVDTRKHRKRNNSQK